jgi:hypothetical protein
MSEAAPASALRGVFAAMADFTIALMLCILLPATYLAAAIGTFWAAGKTYEMTFFGTGMQHELIGEAPGRFWMLRRYDTNGLQDPQATWLYHLPPDQAERLAHKCLSASSRQMYFQEKGLPRTGCVLLDRQESPNFYQILLAGQWLEVQFTNT